MILFTTLGDDVRKSKTGPCLLLKIYNSGPRPNVGILKMLENVDIPKKNSVDFASIWLQRTCWLRYVFFVFFCKIDFQIFSKELGHVNRFSKWLCALMTKVAEAAKCGRGCWLSRVCSIFNYLNQPYFVFLYWYLCICVFVHVYICIWGKVCWLSRVCLLNFQLPKPILPPRYSMER